MPKTLFFLLFKKIIVIDEIFHNPNYKVKYNQAIDIMECR
jgi:hypothetical protein